MKVKISDVQLGMHILEIEITNRCNLNCEYCYNRSKSIVDMPIKDVIELIQFANKSKVSKIVISGGEASLHPEFNILENYLLTSSLDSEIVIQSNGIISKRKIENLKGFNIVHLSFEPEGIGVRKIYVKEIISTAQKLIDNGIYAYFFATIHSKNVDKIDWMIEIAKNSGVEIGFNLCISKKDNKELSLSREVAERITRKLYGYSLDGKILRFTSPLVAVLRSQKTNFYEGIKGGCTAGIAACVILPNGDVVPCPFLRVKTGNIYEEDLIDVWLHSKVFSLLRQRTLFDDPCGSCEYLSYCAGCRARALENTGKLNGFDPYCFKT